MVVCEVQPYDGSLRQARGILAVEGSTYGECSYSSEQVVSLLESSVQHALVALVDGRVVGFLTAFETDTLAGRNLEVDLLAVHPDEQHQGIATQLLESAVRLAAMRKVKRARGLVATSNLASRKAFRKAGYRVSSEVRVLMGCDVSREVIVRATGRFIGVDALSEVEEARYVAEHHRNTFFKPSEIVPLLRPQCHEIWVARQDNTIVGYCEGVWVQTLLYRGVWIESLHASHDDPVVLRNLLARILERAITAGLDKVGCVFESDLYARQRVLAEEGFRWVDEYQWFQFHVGTAR